MEIGFLIDSLGSGGAQRQIVTIASNLSRRGFKINLVYYYNDSFFLKQLLDSNVKVYHVKNKTKNKISLFIKVIFQCRKLKIKHWISFTKGPNLILRFLKLLTFKIIIINSIRDPREKSIDLIFPIGKLTLPLVNKWIANSQNSQNILLHKGIKSKSINLIRNALDLAFFKNDVDCDDVKNIVKKIHNRKFFFIPARFAKVKQQLLCVEAINSLIQEGISLKNYVFVFIGRVAYPDYFENILNFIKKNNLSTHIIIYDAINPIYPLFKKAYCTLIPSLWEGFPNTLIESFYLSIPVIVSDYPSLTEKIENYKNGIIFSNNDHFDLAKAIKIFINLDNNKYKDMCASSYEVFEKNFKLDIIIEKYIKLLKTEMKQ